MASAPNARPRFSRWLLASLLPPAARAEVLFELDREFHLRTQERGADEAARWYRRQVLASVLPALVLRKERLMVIIEQLWQDTRYAVRMLSHARLFTLVAATALGIGIGGGTVTFSAADAFLLKPLPFERPDELVHIWSADERRGRSELRASLQEFEAWQATGAVAAMALFNYTSEELVTGPDPERVPSGRVSANAFDVLGVNAEIGRTFSPGEDQPGAPPVVVVSHAFWQTRLGGRADVLGRSIEIGGIRREVIGVMPASFRFPLPVTQFWVPYSLDRARYTADVQPFQIVARLKPGMTAARAAEALSAASRTLADYHKPLEGRSANVTGLRRALNFAYDIFAVGSVVVGFANLVVLLTAATNISSLMLGRAIRRTREVAIRTAIGATRARMIRQFAVESLALGLAGGVIGALFAFGGVQLMNRVVPDDLYRVAPFQIDLRAAAAVLALSMFAALLFGLMPALRMARVDLAGAMRQESGGATMARSSLRLQASMIVKQVALTIVLLVGTVLVTRSFTALSRTSPGFDARGVLSVQTILSKTRYDTDDRVRAFQNAAVERVAAVAGGPVALVNYLPLNHESDEREYALPGQTPAADGRPPVAVTLQVSPAYFEVLRIPVRAGRVFSDADRADREPVVVINESLGRRHWPAGDAVGRTIRLEQRADPVVIVGVVGDTRQDDLAEGGKPQVFVPLAQEPTTYLRLLARVPGDPRSAAAGVIRAIHDVDPALPVTEVQPLADIVDAFLLPQRSLRMMLIVSGVFSLALAVFGIYGIVACFVSERTRELAIRSALGASPAEIVKMVTGRSLRLVVRGAAVGVPLAAGAAYAMRGLLFGVGAGDPMTYLVVAVLVVGVALIAAVVPARRAASVDPASAIRMP